MCGIVGFTGHRQAAPILLEGLAKLEYRGYDSAGIAVRDGEKDVEIVKAKGRLRVLAEKTNDGMAMHGTCGIGHTRWATGLLSSFLDNTPTYLVFLTTAGALGLSQGMVTALGTVPVKMLEAISCGAVFMGANTYIGNAPNFMVKSIADENGIRMPSFFGYLIWSFGILVPVFIVDTLVFFL